MLAWIHCRCFGFGAAIFSASCDSIAVTLSFTTAPGLSRRAFRRSTVTFRRSGSEGFST
jgi:hypothetical protein